MYSGLHVLYIDISLMSSTFVLILVYSHLHVLCTVTSLVCVQTSLCVLFIVVTCKPSHLHVLCTVTRLCTIVFMFFAVSISLQSSISYVPTLSPVNSHLHALYRVTSLISDLPVLSTVTSLCTVISMKVFSIQ